MPVLFALQSFFSLLMLADCAKKNLSCYWYGIILMPFGEIVYFFMVKIHDFNLKAPAPRPKKSSLPELRYQAKTSPSLENNLRLAQGLHDNKDYRNAENEFRNILKKDPSNKHSLYGLSQCLIGLDKNEEALAVLKPLVESDFDYKDYSATLSLMELYKNLGLTNEVLSLGKTLAKRSSLLQHQIQYANLLIEHGAQQEGQEIIAGALIDYQNSPRYIRKRDKKAFKSAKQFRASAAP